MVGGCWLQSGLLQVLAQLRVVGVVGCKVKTGATAKHDRASGAVQVEHRAHCGAAGVGGKEGGEGRGGSAGGGEKGNGEWEEGREESGEVGHRGEGKRGAESGRRGGRRVVG